MCFPGFSEFLHPQIFGAPDLGVQVSELQASELQFRSFKIPEFQISEFLISEFQVSELLSFGADFLVPEFFRSGAPTSQLTSLVVQEAVEFGKHYKNNGFGIPEFRSFGFLGFGVVRPGISEFGAPTFWIPQVGSFNSNQEFDCSGGSGVGRHYEKTMLSEFQTFLVSELCIPDFGAPVIRSAESFGVPDFGVPDFGVPGFGAPKFGVPSFGIPQVRSSNFSTHEFDCSGSSVVARHYKNSGFGILSSGVLAFLVSELLRP